jgi:hypothetical protein
MKRIRGFTRRASNFPNQSRFPPKKPKAVILPALQIFPLTDQVTDPLSDQVAALLRTLCPLTTIAWGKALYATAPIERTIPEKPNSRLQKCRLTAKGRAIAKPA